MPVNTDLTVTPVKYDSGPSALQTLGTLANLRGQATENILRQAQIQQAGVQTQNLQAEAAAHQMAVKDQNTAQAAFSDPNTARSITSWNGTDPFPLDGKVSPTYADAIKKQIQSAQSAHLTQTEAQQKVGETKLGHVTDTLNGLSDLADGPDFAARANDAIGRLAANGDLDASKIPTIRSKADLAPYAATVGALNGLNDHARKVRETQATIDEKAAQAADAAARTAKASLENTQAQRVQDAHAGLMAVGTPDAYSSFYSRLTPERQAGLPSAINAANPLETHGQLLHAGMTNEQIAQEDEARKNNVNELNLRRQAAQGDPLAVKTLKDFDSAKIRVASAEAQARQAALLGAITPPIKPLNPGGIPTSSITHKPMIRVINPSGPPSDFDYPEQAAEHQKKIDDWKATQVKK